MATAVIAVMMLTWLRPSDLRVGPSWMLPAVEGLLLVAVVVGDPGKIDRRSASLRVLSIGLVALLVADALWATATLTVSLIKGGPETESATALLTAGAIVWVINNVAFSLLYWEMDGGGSAARAHALPRYPDLAFPQQMSPELAMPGWRPKFADYLYLGFTNATAFSPTDVMPLALWAKLSMTIQSVISLVIIGLVIARAVNVLA